VSDEKYRFEHSQQLQSQPHEEEQKHDSFEDEIKKIDERDQNLGLERGSSNNIVFSDPHDEEYKHQQESKDQTAERGKEAEEDFEIP